MRGYFCWHQEREQYRQESHRDGICGRLPVALYLHVLTLLAMLAFLLSACGNSSQPWGYVWADATHLETLSWNESSSQLSGQYSGISFAQVSFPSALHPESYGAAYRGTLKGQTVNMTIGAVCSHNA